MSRYLSAPPPWPLSDEVLARMGTCPNQDEHRNPPVNVNNTVDSYKWKQSKCPGCGLYAIWTRRVPPADEREGGE